MVALILGSTNPEVWLHDGSACSYSNGTSMDKFDLFTNFLDSDITVKRPYLLGVVLSNGPSILTFGGRRKSS